MQAAFRNGNFNSTSSATVNTCLKRDKVTNELERQRRESIKSATGGAS